MYCSTCLLLHVCSIQAQQAAKRREEEEQKQAELEEAAKANERRKQRQVWCVLALHGHVYVRMYIYVCVRVCLCVCVCVCVCGRERETVDHANSLYARDGPLKEACAQLLTTPSSPRAAGGEGTGRGTCSVEGDAEGAPACNRGGQEGAGEGTEENGKQGN